MMLIYSSSFLFHICLIVTITLNLILTAVLGVIPPVVFSPVKSVFIVNEESPPNTIIGTVNAIHNEDLLLVYSIINDATGLFAVNSSSGAVYPNNNAYDIDIIYPDEYSFQVQVEYTFKSTQFQAQANVTVIIRNINDVTPLFINDPYAFTFTQDLVAGSLIGYVSAGDADSSSVNNQISYTVNQSNYTATISVEVDGAVFIVTNFSTGNYTFTIYALDNGIPQRNVSALVQLYVLPSPAPTDTTTPVSSQTHYLFLINEDIVTGSIIGTVVSYPPIGADGNIFYEAISSEFLLEVNDGVLRNLVNNFDYENSDRNYTFDILTRYSSLNSLISSTITSTITVYIRNVNEHAPLSATHSIEVSADTPINAAIGRIPEPTDADGQLLFSYRTVLPSPYIIDVDGIVYLNTTLYYPGVSTYQLDYEISDTSILGVSLTTAAILTINIAQPNIPPVTQLPLRNVTYTHSCPNSTDQQIFYLAWLAPTDDTNPAAFDVTITCTLGNNTVTMATRVTESYATVVLHTVIDRYTQCYFNVSTYSTDPNTIVQFVSGQLLDIYYDWLTSEVYNSYSLLVNSENMAMLEIHNIRFCARDIAENDPLYDINITINNAMYDSSFTNTYTNNTLYVVGYSVGNVSLMENASYNVIVNLPVYLMDIQLYNYTHTLVYTARKTNNQSWDITCPSAPLSYTFTLQHPTDIGSCALQPNYIYTRVFADSGAYYQTLTLFNEEYFSIALLDLQYSGLNNTVYMRMIQSFCSTADLYYDILLQPLLVIGSDYETSATATKTGLVLSLSEVTFCSRGLTIATPDINTFTSTFQSYYSVTTQLANDTLQLFLNNSCNATTSKFRTLNILSHYYENIQQPPVISSIIYYPDDFFIQCTWSLLPRDMYSANVSLLPYPHLFQSTYNLKEFDFILPPDEDSHVPKSLLVPYGVSVGDSLLAAGSDVLSSEISLPAYVLFGSEYYNTAYVSNNGYISLGNPFTSPYPEIFPGYSERTRNANILAPFWTDVDTTLLGNVWYQVYTVDTHAQLLANLSQHAIRSASAPATFSGSWALVVTWHKVPSYPAYDTVFYRCLVYGELYMDSCTKHNTFQAILISDGATSISYALYAYNCMDVMWSKAPFQAAVGYSSGINYYRNHHLSTTNDILQLPCSNPDSTLYPQTILGYTISSTPGVAPADLNMEKCMNWYSIDVRDFILPAGNNFSNATITRTCPCVLEQVAINRLFSTIDSSCYSPIHTNGGDSILCCYNTDTGSLIQPLSHYTRYSPMHALYSVYDAGLYEVCCSDRVTCPLFEARRPQVACNANYGLAGGYGDPHFITLDGLQYTFNGYGEYTLLRYGNAFEVQIRTTQYLSYNATVLTAVAMRSYNSESIHVEINENNLLTVFSNGTDITNTLTTTANNNNHNNPDIYFTSTNLIGIYFVGQTSVTIIFNTGEVLEINISNNITLSIYTTLPYSHRNNIEGLLGNWNDNAFDDLTPMNANYSIILDDVITYSNELDIFNFAQSWRIQASLFVYPLGQNQNNYQMSSFIPTFFTNLNYTNQQSLTCAEVQSCLYDLLLTADSQFAMSTLTHHQSILTTQFLLDNLSPVIKLLNGSQELLLAPNIWYYYLFEVSDETNGHYVIYNSLLTDISITLYTNSTLTTEYVLKFRFTDINTQFGLTLSATDRFGLSSDFSFMISVCYCLFGTCNSRSYFNHNLDLLYARQTCVCQTGYGGESCDTDYNACSDYQCFPAVPCTDSLAPSLLATCGACPDNTTGNGEYCEDYNECSGDRGFVHDCMLTEDCINTIGGYICECKAGYTRNNAGSCIDINECNAPVCHQQCINTPGSYTCNCLTGFSLSTDNYTCNPVLACTTSNKCDVTTQLCAKIGLIEDCYCKPGYLPDITNILTCIDYDECAMGICSHTCSNTIGSYTCSCPTGYQLDTNSRTCIDVNECTTTTTSTSNTPCITVGDICSNTIGSYTCIDPLDPFPINSTVTPYALDVAGIIGGSVAAVIIFIVLVLLIVMLIYTDFWKVWRRRVLSVEEGGDFHSVI